MSQFAARWSAGYLEQLTAPLLQLKSERRASFDPPLDLRGIRLPDENFPADLWIAELQRADIEGIDFSYATVGANLGEAKLRNIRFDFAKLDRVNFSKARMECCSFKSANLIVRMNDTIVESTDFTAAKFGGTSSAQEFGGRRTTFVGCNFDGALFRRVEFRASKFTNCTFVNAKFEKSDLRGAKFAGSAPEAAQFEDCVASQ